MNQHHSYKKRNGNKVTGYLIAFLFIISGLLLLGRNLGIIEPTIFSIIISWPMLLIIMGLYTLLKKEYAGGFILFAIGSYFIIPKLGFVDIPFMSFFWPVILIVTGLYFIFLTNRKKKKGMNLKKENCQTYHSNDGYIHSENMFGVIKHIVADEVFKGGDIKTRFAGTIIDLRRSTLKEEFTYLDVDCKLGGIELYLPAHWNVKTEASTFLGGCEDSRLPVPIMDTEHTFVIRGILSLSGIEIKS